MPDTDEIDYRIDLSQIDYSCMDECSADSPQILLVAVSASGLEHNAYDLGCAEDTVKSPGVYDDRRLVGTHWLNDEALTQLCPGDLETYDVAAFVEDCRSGTCTSGHPALIIGIDPQGGFHLLCWGCAMDIRENPGARGNRGITLHGTHILTDEVLRREFPEDFDDEGE